MEQPDLPNFTDNIPESEYGTLEKGNSVAIKQVRSYLFEIGLQYAVITNGHQFIIAKFSNTDGSEWRKNKCSVFNGLDDIEARFIDFFNILSKSSTILA